MRPIEANGKSLYENNGQTTIDTVQQTVAVKFGVGAMCVRVEEPI